MTYDQMTLKDKIAEHTVLVLEKVIATLDSGEAVCSESIFDEMYAKVFENPEEHPIDRLETLYNVTRVEVIDETGRAYVKRHCRTDLAYQDEGRTLKLFLHNL